MSTTYAPCNSCRSLNRFDSNRSGNPICGQCKKPLSVHNGVTDATTAGLNTLIESSPLPVVVDFWAPWCGPCRSFAPTFESTAKRRMGKAVFAKVNTESESGAGQRHGIQSIPTLVIFANGQEVGRKSGTLDSISLERWLNQRGA